MAKFVIACPQCGKYAQADSGLFGFIGRTRKVDCACGYTINIKTDKLASRNCPHCGNDVIFDQSEGEKARCPVCGEAINTIAEQTHTVEFSCAQCGIRLRTEKGRKTCTCPICAHENPVAEQVMIEDLKKSGLASTIKFEGDQHNLIWKHPIEDFCLGSQLIVDESQEAIFYRDGQALDTFPPGTHTLETQRLPLLDQAYRLPTNNGGHFHSKVYFVNLITHMGIKWGVGEIRFYEPTYKLPIELGLRGTFNLKITNARKLLQKIVGTAGALTRDQLMDNDGKGYFTDLVRMQVRSYVAAAIADSGIDLLDIDRHLIDLSAALQDKLNPVLGEYGLEIAQLLIAGVKEPDDPAFRAAKKQHQDEIIQMREIEMETRLAEATLSRTNALANVDILTAKGEAEVRKIHAAADLEIARQRARVEAEEMREKGMTYADQTARMVGLEAAKNVFSGSGGGMGDLASMGLALGALTSVTKMTQNTLTPLADAGIQPAQPAAVPGGWVCPECGAANLTSKCCPECGCKKPEPKTAWTCPECGAAGLTSKCCPECGCKRPAPPAPWVCPECGAAGLTSKCCPECGCRKPEPKTTWDCPACGASNLTSKCCPECGHKKGM